ncbi:hypothetical protein BXZ70DRAFT_633902 [Cristinia sonorae]|uniref:Uncharacterized protein n=1 Tax=Cristinia sonorae TaxID=1940300 RepID=A0A8K0XKB0_9AGAR|nr:hypothetical protein BXZ70DRAFT_633902 [Cristinia sonorae]
MACVAELGRWVLWPVVVFFDINALFCVSTVLFSFAPTALQHDSTLRRDSLCTTRWPLRVEPEPQSLVSAQKNINTYLPIETFQQIFRNILGEIKSLPSFLLEEDPEECEIDDEGDIVASGEYMRSRALYSTISTLVLVCKWWKAILEGMDDVWARVDVCLPAGAQRSLLHCGDSTAVQLCSTFDEWPVTVDFHAPKFVEAFTARSHQVTSIFFVGGGYNLWWFLNAVNGLRSYGILQQGGAFSNVQEMYLDNRTSVMPRTVDGQCDLYLPNLRKITLKSISLHIVGDLPKVEVAKLSYYTLDASHLAHAIKFIARMPALKDLELTLFNHLLWRYNFDSRVTTPFELQHLTAIVVDGLTSDMVQLVFNTIGMPNLESTRVQIADLDEHASYMHTGLSRNPDPFLHRFQECRCPLTITLETQQSPVHGASGTVCTISRASIQYPDVPHRAPPQFCACNWTYTIRVPNPNGLRDLVRSLKTCGPEVLTRVINLRLSVFHVSYLLSGTQRENDFDELLVALCYLEHMTLFGLTPISKHHDDDGSDGECCCVDNPYSKEARRTSEAGRVVMSLVTPRGGEFVCPMLRTAAFGFCEEPDVDGAVSDREVRKRYCMAGWIQGTVEAERPRLRVGLGLSHALMDRLREK